MDIRNLARDLNLYGGIERDKFSHSSFVSIPITSPVLVPSSHATIPTMTSTDATKKLIHDLNVDILGRLSKGVVKDSVFNEKRTDDTKALKKKDVIAGIVNEIEKIGVKRMSDSLHVADAQAICETLEVDFKV